MLSQDFIQIICNAAGIRTDGANAVITSVGGGCINRCYRLETGRQRLFLKVNSSHAFPGMFKAEEKGLLLLAQQDELIIPRPVANGIHQGDAFLALEWLDGGLKTEQAMAVFGRALANLHRCTNAAFGLDHDNYIGSLPQSNREYNDWAGFFAEERLGTQVRRAVDEGTADASLISLTDRFCTKLSMIFPNERPALLHGDLWGGNYMITASGKPCIFDPAVYYGHREMDIAMSRLFGGFNPVFYNAYKEAWPLEPGWRERMDICNIYPLLVHHNLFGGSYLSQALCVIKRYL